MRRKLEVPVLAHEQLGEYEFEITLHAPEVAREARAGQFMQVQYDDNLNPFTRRPFSVYRVNQEKGTFSILYLARGHFTQGLRDKFPGEKLSVVGPLGNWYEPDSNPQAAHILVAGGVGAPPLYLLAWQMLQEGYNPERIVVVNGARSRSLLCGVAEFDSLGVRVVYTTDDGSHGIPGLVTDALVPLLEEYSGAHVYTCGPTAMLRAVGEICVARGVPCQVSVETMMPCGLGVCMGCVIKVKDPAGFRYERSCYEGPVFPADQILWE